MHTHSPKEITQLLVAWGDGDQAALDELTPLVHEELRRLAHHYMGGERTGHTLQTTALVNEAYIRLIDWKNVRWQSRAHFFAVSAQLMRRILVDFARSRGYQKRGGGALAVSLDEAAFVSDDKGTDLVALDEALGSLAKLDARQSKVVELRFFGGLSVEETAEVLKVSSGTVSTLVAGFSDLAGFEISGILTVTGPILICADTWLAASNKITAGRYPTLLTHLLALIVFMFFPF